MVEQARLRNHRQITSATPKQTKPGFNRKKWGLRIFWLGLIAMVLYAARYAFWGAYLLATGPLGGTEAVYTDTSCGSGEYRLVVYQYKSGDGYLELTNNAGKVFGRSEFSKGIDYAPFKWAKDCKKVMVGSDDGLTYLRVE